MALIKDIRHLTTFGNNGGMIVPLPDGTLLRGGDTTGGTNGIYKSTDITGSSWTRTHTYATSGWNSRLNFMDPWGNIYVGTINVNTPGRIFRSSNLGASFVDVATSQASGWWRMCYQPTTGYLYASEYSIGSRDANEKYAYNIWYSKNQGLTWAIFYTSPKQSSPGAKDGPRHTHGIWCDLAGNLIVGFGDPSFALPATRAYYLNDDGTLGDLLDTTANGYTAVLETNSGRVLAGGDQNPVKVYEISKRASSAILDLNTIFGSYYNTAVFELVEGKYGVVYALTNGATGTNDPVVLATPDYGNHWAVLRFADDLVGANFLTIDRRAGGRLYVTRAETPGVNYASFPDLRPSDIIGTKLKQP